MHGKQYLVTIRAKDEELALHTMYFADEVRDPAAVVGDLPGDEQLSSRELSIARQLVGSMTSGWNPDNYRDTYRDRVEDLIERKRKGEEIVTEGEPEPERVTDLAEALRRSAEQMTSRKAGSGGRAGSGGKAGSGRKAS
jgi:DNA end-binding protein Ku